MTYRLAQLIIPGEFGGLSDLIIIVYMGLWSNFTDLRLFALKQSSGTPFMTSRFIEEQLRAF